MVITDIEISHYAYDSHRARHTASVEMKLKDRVVQLFCQLELPENASPSNRAAEFVRDAIRQLRRMPEYRSGAEELRFADHLLRTRAA
ncbi:MAG: hypothetical protein GJ676_18620 [Rhodobacteraceae bacterium]|nr:hypothetical protein [Paracoccaceae bacterium]